ncbi:efflux RND transporter periplasmic adaptor subunit [candidate division CSSED10-310 bacterium]|uniref:Efflux RND transporter periplasmic adaptor subunit n=1 Tax=candidate division CSSED10-310 bacterium TaxID=2855610 RepID=A0ABV6YY80_UNCC1
MTKSFIFIMTGLVFMWVLLLGSSCSSPPAPTSSKSEIIKVNLEPVSYRDVAFPIRTSGIISAKAQIKLSFKVGGIIQKILVEEGEIVRQGQLLAQLDLAEITAHVNQAKTLQKKAQRDSERVKNLFRDKAVTLENVQDAETALSMATSSLNVARFNLQHSKIIAPTRGAILKRFAEKNELVAPGIPIYLFGSAQNEVVIRVKITDRDIVRIQLGDPARVTLDAYPDAVLEAEVSEIAESTDPRTGLFEVELTPAEFSQKLISGFVTHVEIRPTNTQRFAFVPVEALVEGNGDTAFVFTLYDDNPTVRKIPVRIGHIFTDAIAVRSGLENVTQVVTAGAFYLIDGSKVEVVKVPAGVGPEKGPAQSDQAGLKTSETLLPEGNDK